MGASIRPDQVSLPFVATCSVTGSAMSSPVVGAPIVSAITANAIRFHAMCSPEPAFLTYPLARDRRRPFFMIICCLQTANPTRNSRTTCWRRGRATWMKSWTCRRCWGPAGKALNLTAHAGRWPSQDSRLRRQPPERFFYAKCPTADRTGGCARSFLPDFA